MTLKRLSFQVFFRRVRDGEAPPVPALQGARATQRLGYKTPCRLRVGLVKMRGKPSNEGEPKTCESVHRRRRSHASVTVECAPKRCHGQQGAGLDWGFKTLATLATEAGETVRVENPRHLKNALERIFVRASESWLASGEARATGPRPVNASMPCPRRSPIADNFLHKENRRPGERARFHRH